MPLSQWKREREGYLSAPEIYSSLLSKSDVVKKQLAQTQSVNKAAMASKRIAALALRTFSSQKGSGSLDLSGIFPPIPTPFNQDETLAFDKLEKNFAVWQKIPFRGRFFFIYL